MNPMESPLFWTIVIVGIVLVGVLGFFAGSGGTEVLANIFP